MAIELQKKAFEKGITLSPGIMYSPSGGFENYIRINCSVPMHPSTLKAIDIIGKLAIPAEL